MYNCKDITIDEYKKFFLDEDKRGLFTLWITFVDKNRLGNTIKCGRKFFSDIISYEKFFIFMFPYYNIELRKGMTRKSFIIYIIQNVKSNN